MTDNSRGLHEADEALNPAILDRHRAIASLMEEIEAVDWYDQRVAAATDPELKELLAHNRDEEKEHAAMMIEWLRRHDERFAEELDTYLYCKGRIVAAEEEATSGADAGATDAGSGASVGSLGIGSLKGEV